MRPGIHPEHRPVVFRDRSAGTSVLTRATVTSPVTVEWKDGRRYPAVDGSSDSHPLQELASGWLLGCGCFWLPTRPDVVRIWDGAQPSTWDGFDEWLGQRSGAG